MDSAQSRIKAQHTSSHLLVIVPKREEPSFENQNSNMLQAHGPDMLDFAHSWNELLGKMRSKSSHKSSALVQVLAKSAHTWHSVLLMSKGSTWLQIVHVVAGTREPIFSILALAESTEQQG